MKTNGVNTPRALGMSTAPNKPSPARAQRPAQLATGGLEGEPSRKSGAAPRQPLSAGAASAASESRGNIVMENEFASMSGQNSAAQSMFAERFKRGYDIVHQAETALPDSVLMKAQQGDNIQLRLSTFDPAKQHSNATTTATVDEHCILSGDVAHVAEAIHSGSPLQLTVKLTNERSGDFTSDKEAIAQTLNHEISGHGAPIVQVFEHAQCLETAKEAAEFIQQQRQPGGWLNGDAHHVAIAESAGSQADVNGHGHFISTHQNMVGAASDERSKRRLTTAFDNHVDLQRRTFGL